MIVIYTQDKTIIIKDIEEAKSTLVKIYGNKLGEEAYNSLYKVPSGATFRKNGGPLVKIVDVDEAEKIREKEIEIGMIR